MTGRRGTAWRSRKAGGSVDPVMVKQVFSHLFHTG